MERSEVRLSGRDITLGRGLALVKQTRDEPLVLEQTYRRRQLYHCSPSVCIWMALYRGSWITIQEHAGRWVIVLLLLLLLPLLLLLIVCCMHQLTVCWQARTDSDVGGNMDGLCAPYTEKQSNTLSSYLIHNGVSGMGGSIARTFLV